MKTTRIAFVAQSSLFMLVLAAGCGSDDSEPAADAGRGGTAGKGAGGDAGQSAGRGGRGGKSGNGGNGGTSGGSAGASAGTAGSSGSSGSGGSGESGRSNATGGTSAGSSGEGGETMGGAAGADPAGGEDGGGTAGMGHGGASASGGIGGSGGSGGAGAAGSAGSAGTTAGAGGSAAGTAGAGQSGAGQGGSGQSGAGQGGGGQGGGGQGGTGQGGTGQGGAGSGGTAGTAQAGGGQAGAPATCVGPSDCPGADAECSTRTCDDGICGSSPAGVGTGCNENGGNVCDGAGSCIVTVMVLVVGDGSSELTTSATAVHLEERKASDGSLFGAPGNPVAMPTTTPENGARLTLSGIVTVEGLLSLSSDGRSVVLAGYDAAPGTSSIYNSSTQTFNRIVGAVNRSYAVDTTTRFNLAFHGASVRAVCSIDGTGFWTAGGGTGGGDLAGGIWYIPLGATGGTRLLDAPLSARACLVANGQLYGSSTLNPHTNVFRVGSGAPTTGRYTASALPGMPALGQSSTGFVFFDRNPAVTGMDTLYVADDRGVNAYGGIHKWTFDGETWTLVRIFSSGLTDSVVDVTGYVTGNHVRLLATTRESPARVVSYLDDDSGDPAVTFATAATNTAYRGITVGPR